ncbi:MAG: hypothetical protein LLF89_04535, partial [Spirochaetaceae bacterium]|nr:hypothetical protein [Spirochaetaceae bacterium]
LQRHYFGAMKQIAGRLAQYPNVIGFDSLNEPGAGFIGISDVRERKKDADMPGLSPTPWEAICAGEGYPTDSANIGIRGLGMKTTGRVQLGTPGIRAWLEGRNCLWRRVGVWDFVHDVPTLLRPNWFVERIGSSSGKGNGPHGAAAGLSAGDAINEFYLKPFIARFSDEIGGTAHDNHRFAIFIEGFQNDKDPSWKEGSQAILVNATHWYDAMTLTLKRWTGFLAYDQDSGKAIIGRHAVREYFKEALGRIKRHSADAMGDSPTIIGEFGLPFYMNKGKAFRTGNYRLHEKALSAYYDALDANLLDGTLWHYSAINTHRWGDAWNGEDLSVFCLDEAGGGRALAGFVRPYALAVAGELLEMRFNSRTGEFCLAFSPDPAIAAGTEVYVPFLQYPYGFSFIATGAVAQRDDRKGASTAEDWCTITIRPQAGAKRCDFIIRRKTKKGIP